MKFAFSFLLLFLFLSSIGQSTYTSQNFATPGTSYTFSRYTGFDLNIIPFTSTGENKIWNFSQTGISTQFNKSFLLPDATGYRESFVASCVLNGGNFFNCISQWYTLSNLAAPLSNPLDLWEVQLSNMVEFQKIDNGSLQTTILGASILKDGTTIPLTLSYLQADIVYNFPINYSNKDTSNSSYRIDLTPFQIDLKYTNRQQRINHVDGWGTLVTPFKTHAQVLRIKTMIVHNDTAFYNGQTIPLNTTEILYSWLDPAFGCPVFQAKGYMQGTLQVFTEAIYIDTIRCLNPQISAISLPISPIIDPETQTANVHFMNFSTNCNQFSWNFGDGTATSELQNPDHEYTTHGIYNVQLIGCNTICSPTHCDSLQMAVVVTDTTLTFASFVYNPQNPCQNDSVTFQSTSLNADLLEWYINDHLVSENPNLSFLFDSAGPQNISLIARNEYNSDTSQQEILIEENPWVFAGTDSTIFSGDTIQLYISAQTNANVDWEPKQFLNCYDCPNPLAYPPHTTSFIITAFNNCGLATDTLTIFVDTLNTIGKNENRKYFIVTFSGNEYLTIKATLPIVQSFSAILYNETGKVLTSMQTQCGEIIISTGRFPKGLYLLKMQSGENVAQVQKWIKQ